MGHPVESLIKYNISARIIPIKMAQLLPSLSVVVLKGPTQQCTISRVRSWSCRALSRAREFWIAWPILRQQIAVDISTSLLSPSHLST